MKVTVRMHGNLRRFAPEAGGSLVVILAEGSTVGAALDRLGVQHETWLAAVNGRAVDRATVLAEGDLLECFEAISGGSAEDCPRLG